MQAAKRWATSPAQTPAAERPCFIHIGTHKTGTTSIQAFLAENRSQLLARGIFIPRSASNGEAGFACHHGIVRQLLGYAREQLNGGLDAVVAELAASDSTASCISSEDISLLYDRPEPMRQLRDAIRAAGFEPKIIIYVRPQVSYATAVYATNVQSGYRLSFATFLSDVIERGGYVWDGGFGPPFEYVMLLDAFAAVFGRDAIIVRPFKSDAPDSALLRSFMNILLPQLHDLTDFRVPPKRSNRTLTFSAVLRILGARDDFDQHVRFAPFTLVQLGRMWLRFAARNRQLAKRYGVRIPVLDFGDLIRALPIRRSLSLTRQLWQARAALRNVAPTLLSETK